MKITKRLLAFFLTLLMVFTSVPVSVFAQESDSLENLIEQTATQKSDSEETINATSEITYEGTGVASAEALEAALASDAAKICITADFELDRTFYITRDVTIYSVQKHTLTRKADFAGDIFVVGEAADGTVCPEKVTLTVGTEDAKNSDMLIIDGNKANMTATVTGTVFFVCKNGQADLYPDLTVTNCEKKGNERALNKDKYTLCSDRTIIGGPVAIIVENHKDDPATISDGVMNVYGGKYTNNGVSQSGVYGGVFFNHSTLNVYDGNFENNYASRAGVFYNYRKMYLHKAVITGNTATTSGGAIYLPASSGAKLYIGGDTKTDDIQVTFKNNTAKDAGAVYSSGILVVRNTLFESNTSTETAAAIYGTGSYNNITVFDSTFTKNESGEIGGAIYVTSKHASAEYELNISNTKFNENKSATNGGAVYLSNPARAYVADSSFSENTASSYGGTFYVLGATVEFKNVTFTGNSANSGGVLYADMKTVDETDVPADIIMDKVTATGNIASAKGGVGYLGKSNILVYNSTFKQNTADGGSAFCFYPSAQGAFYNCLIEENICPDDYAGNAGAFFLNTNTSKITVHSSTFKNNTSNGLGGAIFMTGKSLLDLFNITATGNTAAKGGFIYITTTGTTITNSGLTVSGNTATVGGPILFSNSAGAKICINKNNYKDSDVTTPLDDAYWTGALYYPEGKGLKVEETEDEIPLYAENGNESAGDMYDATDVSSADELAAALEAGKEHIRVVADFELDRTFTVKSDAVIFSTKAHTLKRAENFGGIIFDIAPALSEKPIVFGLGNKISETENLFVLDGNKDKMSVEVTGAVINVQQGAKAELYKNITLTSNSFAPVSVKGEITVNGGNFANNTSSVGAAVIYCEGTAEIKGGNFTSNSSTVNGGVIYNKGTLVITDGAFISNSAANGAVVYNEGTLDINGAIFTSNKATENGGAVYNAGTLNIGEATFTSNNAVNGGAVATEKSASVNGTAFTSNKATLGGAIYVLPVAEGEASLVITSASFKKNSADKGGAISAERTNLVVSADFEANSAANGGSVYLFSGCNADFTGANVLSSSSKETGGFLYSSGSAVSFLDCSIESSTAVKSGAAIYVGKGSSLDVVSCQFKNNTAQSNGGAVAIAADTTSIKFDTVEFTGNNAVNGGAIYSNSNGQLEITDCSFEACTAENGGAIYSDSGEVKFTSVSFISNKAQRNGGAVVLKGKTTGTLYGIIAENNESEKSGAAFFCEDAVIVLTDSEFKNNIAKNNGGAISAEGDAAIDCRNTVFENNKADKNGGAVNIVTDGTTVKFTDCSVISNNAAENGGAFYAGSGSVAELYNVTVTNNKADYGAVLYITGISTMVTVSGMTVSGNLAEESGYIIYGNSSKAVLRMDKTNFVDSDEQSALDDAYWAKAIAGIVSLDDPDSVAPDYSEKAVNVSTAKELEVAINKNTKNICIIADFAIDRTYFIKSDVAIYSKEPHTLTRADNFGGDFFVVGETSKGVRAYFDSKVVRLTVGHPQSKAENLLIIDGNRDNMKTQVNGSIFFVSYGAHVDLYDNLTVKNCYKQGNERTYKADYKFSRPNRIGGPVAIIANGMLTVHGGNYINNRVNDEDASTEEGRNSSIGGVFYNSSNLIIRNGNFEGNQAARGGIVYNYKIVRIVAGTFRNNIGTLYSGVYYSTSSAGIHFLMGSTDKDGEKLLFKNNKSKYGGSVVTSSHFSAVVCIGNTYFKNNTVTSGNGGVISTTGMLTVKNAEFIGNKAGNYGGAVYFNRSNNDEITRLGNLEGCLFEGNQAKYGGAVATTSSAVTDYKLGSISTINDCIFRDNVATSSGGAVYSDNLSTVTVENNTFENNRSGGEAGVMYVIGKSKITFKDNSFVKNTSTSHGGAISVRSATVNFNNDIFSGNTAKTNGGAMYVSYSSAMDINSHVTLDGVQFIGNSGSNGGAIYATRRAIEENAILIDAKNTVFEENTAKSSAGALLLTAGIKTYFYNTTFSKNIVKSNGGAVSVGSKSLFEADKVIFTANEGVNGGAVTLGGAATAIMNDVTATENKASTNGGFAYNEGAVLKLYNSTIKNNIADAGSAIYFFTSAQGGVYNTIIEGNTCDEGNTGNAGAILVYTGGTKVTLNGCTLKNNTSNGLGGGILVSGKGVLELYSTTATGNSAAKGGFMYETAAGSVVDIAGLTVSGNTASVGGPVIWGNTKNAVLNIDKSKYKDNDKDVTQEGYWSEAIVNLLTVNDVSKDIVAAEEYVSKQKQAKPATTKKPVSVEDVFTLAKKSSDADINSNYNKLKKLDNSSNFMSRSTKDYKNINGKTVTVDTFVYPTKGKTDNGIVGLGILLYQALLYKKANPKEEMYIDVSSYRFSVQSAVNINRNSRYFGYMRDLVGVNYDKYGFVRLSYLLITAAKMGIHVNVIGQLDAYPISKTNPNFYEYFTHQLSDPCDPKYASGKVISDFLDFNFCYWTLDAKGGTDMMHTKMCTVSHYLDMNGVAHRNAVWSSSSNLDGVKADGQNANWKLQTALLITNHDEMYRVATNYLRLISSLCGQEEVIEFQDIVNRRSTEQIDLINQGRSKEIPADEQLVYLGTAKDDVFELYFTPFGGSHVAWDEVYNPYCKYLREMYESEDYMIFAYNAAEYSGRFTLGQQMEGMIIDAFHKNRNVKNKIYSYMESFDPTTFDDLVVGKDIGYKSFFERPFGKVHNKDMQLSYVKNGKRQFVTLHNSLNFHSGSMSYQSNFMIVVKDKSCAEDTVFSTIARYSTTGGIADHTYSAEKTVAATKKKDGYTYKECIYCGDKVITGKTHYAGSWVVDKKATTAENGVRHKACKHCGDIVVSEEIARLPASVNVNSLSGKTFTSSASSLISVASDKTPLTIEARIRVPKSMSSRAGTIAGNYGVKKGNVLNLEIYENGKVKLYIKNSSKTFTHTFKKDIRSDEPVDIAVVFSSGKAVLYVNGEKTETAKLKVSVPKTLEQFKVGGDNRSKNTNHFKGKLYFVHLYSDVRTSSELKKDRLYVSPEASSLIYSAYYNDKNAPTDVKATSLDSMKFSAKKLNKLNKALSSAPKTIEATIQLSKSVKGEGGVIFGNYNKSYSAPFNLEIYTKGRVKLYFKNGKKTVSHVFKTDIRSDSAVNIAVTISGKTAVLYVDGVKKETAKLKASLPSVTKNFCVGGDNRKGNSNYFKGKLYSLHVFSDVRSASEIKRDMIAVASDADKLMYSAYVTTSGGQKAMLKGQTFSKSVRYNLPKLKKTPYTIEATVQLSEKVKKDGGVIVGSYDGKSGNYLNLSVADKGRLKVTFKNGKSTVSHTFKYDIRTKNAPVNLAVTIKDKTATLYINGVKKEAAKLSKALGSVTKSFAVGGDMRSGNVQYFKGKIYSVNLFSDVRTAAEIKNDAKVVTKNAKSLLYAGSFYTNKCNINSVGKSHTAGSWKTVYKATKSECGVSRNVCTSCGKTLEVKEIKKTSVKLNSVNYTTKNGKSFTKSTDAVAVKNSVNGKAFTFEAMVQLSPDFKDRGGTVIGNYNGDKSDQLNVEVYTNGKLRLYYKVNSKAYTHTFSTDIRSAKKTHIAITVEGKTAKLYINGKYKESCKLKVELPDSIKNLKVGADNRSGEPNCFNGRIYSVYLFNTVRTASQLQKDAYVVSAINNNAVYSAYYG